MNLQEKVIAHKYFQLKIYQKDGYDFQNFFTSIMNKYDSEFTTIKTQGNMEIEKMMAIFHLKEFIFKSMLLRK